MPHSVSHEIEAAFREATAMACGLVPSDSDLTALISAEPGIAAEVVVGISATDIDDMPHPEYTRVERALDRQAWTSPEATLTALWERGLLPSNRPDDNGVAPLLRR